MLFSKKKMVFSRHIDTSKKVITPISLLPFGVGFLTLKYTPIIWQKINGTVNLSKGQFYNIHNIL